MVLELVSYVLVFDIFVEEFFSWASLTLGFLVRDTLIKPKFKDSE